MAETEGKKKKSKLPIIAVMVMLLAGGGFFVLKGQAKSGEKPKIEMAEKETDVDEFLTNSSDPSIYVRAKITVRLRKDFDETKFKENTGDVRDAVLGVLNSTAPKDITDSTKRGVLKKELADAMNTALEPPDPDKDSDDSKKSSKHKSDDSDDSHHSKSNDDWDSKTGPVLKVRFMNLATQ
jgi:flagellar basal body-associated protein FliL